MKCQFLTNFRRENSNISNFSPLKIINFGTKIKIPFSSFCSFWTKNGPLTHCALRYVRDCTVIWFFKKTFFAWKRHLETEMEDNCRGGQDIAEHLIVKRLRHRISSVIDESLFLTWMQFLQNKSSAKQSHDMAHKDWK